MIARLRALWGAPAVQAWMPIVAYFAAAWGAGKLVDLAHQAHEKLEEQAHELADRSADLAALEHECETLRRERDQLKGPLSVASEPPDETPIPEGGGLVRMSGYGA